MARFREPVTLIRCEFKVNRELARRVAAETHRIVEEAVYRAAVRARERAGE